MICDHCEEITKLEAENKEKTKRLVEFTSAYHETLAEKIDLSNENAKLEAENKELLEMDLAKAELLLEQKGLLIEQEGIITILSDQLQQATNAYGKCLREIKKLKAEKAHFEALFKDEREARLIEFEENTKLEAENAQLKQSRNKLANVIFQAYWDSIKKLRAMEDEHEHDEPIGETWED